MLKLFFRKIGNVKKVCNIPRKFSSKRYASVGEIINHSFDLKDIQDSRIPRCECRLVGCVGWCECRLVGCVPCPSCEIRVGWSSKKIKNYKLK